MPFGNSDRALAPSGWDTLFACILKERGIELNRPIWRFAFPAAGGEIRVFQPLVPYGKGEGIDDPE
jgi:hypothetical protein